MNFLHPFIFRHQARHRALVLIACLTALLGSPLSVVAKGVDNPAQKSSGKVSTISNLRYYGSAERSRLVFDLVRPVKYTQQHISNPDQMVINLTDAVLSTTAKHKVESHTLPSEITIKQSSARGVQVTVNMEDITGVKLQTLTKPHRLVVDYVLKKADVPVAQPKSTLPPVGRQITELLQRQARLDIETIVLDPGHGGKDPGAVSRSRRTEKSVVLDVALRLKELLRNRLDKKVIMTRDKDTFIELDDRAKFANSHKADLFVSIHINSHPSGNVRGIELYHFGMPLTGGLWKWQRAKMATTFDHARGFLDLIKADLALSKSIEESQNLAWETRLAIVRLLATIYNLDDHGVKTAPFYVLRYTAMPSILAELSFISNSADEKLLRSPAYRQKMAEGLFEGIRNYLRSAQIASAR